MLSYNEQRDGKDIVVVIDKRTAVRRQKALAEKEYSYSYLNDNEALNDFIVIHWAWETTKADLQKLSVDTLMELSTPEAADELFDRNICSACGEYMDEPFVNHNNAECS